MPAEKVQAKVGMTATPAQFRDIAECVRVAHEAASRVIALHKATRFDERDDLAQAAGLETGAGAAYALQGKAQALDRDFDFGLGLH